MVIKRDGRKVEFDRQKIVDAIIKAFEDECGYPDKDMESCADKIADGIAEIAEVKDLHVEEIQDKIEKRLMSTKYKNGAKSYINYRYLHGLARDQYKDMIREKNEKICINAL